MSRLKKFLHMLTKNNFLGEITISVILIILLILLLNPFNFWMPTAMHMMMIVGLAVFIIIFAGYVWKEKSHDERESLHRNIAARYGYLAGIGILSVGVIIQSMQHTLDIWLIVSLTVMILAKIIGVIYSNQKY